MTTVFLSGSRKIGRLNDVIRQRIDNMIRKEFHIVIGDANGADRAMQEYLAERRYPHVVIYCSGSTCRNNLSQWEIKHIPVDSQLKGREFYTVKDIAMASEADFGFLLWDGKSSGTFRNLIELITRGKKALVYLSTNRSCHQVTNMEEAQRLLATCGSTIADELCKKLQITPPAICESETGTQLTLDI